MVDPQTGSRPICQKSWMRALTIAAMFHSRRTDRNASPEAPGLQVSEPA
jgi:hypothetical protein